MNTETSEAKAKYASKDLTADVKRWAGVALGEAIDAQQFAGDVLELLRMARPECEWQPGDVEQSRKAQRRLLLLIELAEARAEEARDSAWGFVNKLTEIQDLA